MDVDMNTPFRTAYSFEKRREESSRIRLKFKDRIPVIVERASHSASHSASHDAKNPSIPNIDKKKYLVPPEFTFGQLIYVVRLRMQLPPETAMFCYIGKSQMPSTSTLMKTLYQKHKDEDGFLYMIYAGENTFGK